MVFLRYSKHSIFYFLSFLVFFFSLPYCFSVYFPSIQSFLSRSLFSSQNNFSIQTFHVFIFFFFFFFFLVFNFLIFFNFQFHSHLFFTITISIIIIIYYIFHFFTSLNTILKSLLPFSGTLVSLCIYTYFSSQILGKIINT